MQKVNRDADKQGQWMIVKFVFCNFNWIWKKIQAMSNSVKVLSYSDQYTKHAAKVRTIAYDQLNTINQ